MERSKITKYLKTYKKRTTPYRNQLDFQLAICYTLLGEYDQAQRLYENNFLDMFASPKLWKKSGQPYWLIDICVLSGRLDLLADVKSELNDYKSDKLGNSPAALYANAMTDLLLSSKSDISISIFGLLKDPRIKICIALGEALNSIIANNQPAFESALINLLEVHEGQATRGSLRSTPEGWLCMSAMSLAYVAQLHNFQVKVVNDYLNLGYLEFLLLRGKPTKH